MHSGWHSTLDPHYLVPPDSGVLLLCRPQANHSRKLFCLDDALHRQKTCGPVHSRQNSTCSIDGAWQCRRKRPCATAKQRIPSPPLAPTLLGANATQEHSICLCSEHHRADEARATGHDSHTSTRAALSKKAHLLRATPDSEAHEQIRHPQPKGCQQTSHCRS